MAPQKDVFVDNIFSGTEPVSTASLIRSRWRSGLHSKSGHRFDRKRANEHHPTPVVNASWPF
jgi:hypothetical protein